MAFGARAEDIIRMVLGRSTRMTTAGVVVGIVSAAYLTRFMASLLFGVDPLEVLRHE